MRYTSLLRGSAVVTPVIALALTSAAGIAQAHTAQSGPAALTSAQARALSTNVTDKVIVVFKNQLPSLPDTAGNAARRTAAVRSLQSAVRAQLAATHARNVKSISLVNAVAATVSPGEARLLRSNPAVSEVVPDLPIPVAATSPASRLVRPGTARGMTPLPGACPTKNRVQLDPEAIVNIHAVTQYGHGPSAQELGYTGKGVKVGFIADGVDPNNPDFIRANGKHVFVDYQDFSGTGTNAPTSGAEAFLDSSSIAAQGRHVYDIASYGVGLNRPCLIRILGVAPGASLVGLNVFGSANVAYNSVFLEAINYAVTVDHVNVLNESFGSNPFPDTASLDLTRLADEAATKAGVTVTVSTGDSGVTNTIGSPATDPAVISAGASTTYRAYAQTGVGGIPPAKGWIDNNISGLSSAGFDQTGGTVDVVAPGDLNWALCTPKPALYGACTNFSGQPAAVELQGGTSEAAPLTAGVAALVIQAYRQAHHGQSPSPAVVKRIIVSTAQDIGAPAEQQGAGLIDAYQAVLAAASYRVTHRVGGAVLDNPTQLNAVAQPTTTEHLRETLTNDGARAVIISPVSRTLSAYHAVDSGSLKLDKANGYGAVVQFGIPGGRARLNFSAALPDTANISLIGPDGRLAAYNLPQGTGNYGNAQVTFPKAGRWTALVWTTPPASGKPVTAAFQASTATWVPFGTLSTNEIKLAPGASGTVTLTVPTPAQAGDVAGTLLLRTGDGTNLGFVAGETTSIPVTLRSLIPTPDPSTTVTGALTGGNGRQTSTGQTSYYQVQIKSGTPALNVGVRTPNAANTMFAELINPSGVAVSTAVNSLRVRSGGKITFTPETGTQLHVLHPVAGRWTVMVDFFNTVSGTAVSQPVTITANDQPVTASAGGLPQSASTQLASGTPVTFNVKVTNTGSTPEAYFTDARLSSQATTALAAQGKSKLTLPNLSGVVPTYLVPSHATAISATVSSTARLFFDFTYNYGDPDVMSATGKTVTQGYSAPEVSPGDWTITPFLAGPTGAKPATARTATTSMSATFAAFDPAVNSTTGDLWLSSVHTGSKFAPVVANPGQTVTIPVTITPSGTPGSTVTGTLYVSDSSFIPGTVTFDALPGLFPEGSDVAAFGYSYTIK